MRCLSRRSAARNRSFDPAAGEAIIKRNPGWLYPVRQFGGRHREGGAASIDRTVWFAFSIEIVLFLLAAVIIMLVKCSAQ